MSAVRWKEPGSGADPELREVLRHAGGLGPSEAQLAALTAALLAVQPPPQSSAPKAPTAQALLPKLLPKMAPLALLAGVGSMVYLSWPSQQPATERPPSVTPSAAPTPPATPASEPPGVARAPEGAHRLSAGAPEGALRPRLAERLPKQPPRMSRSAHPPAKGVSTAEPPAQHSELVLLQGARQLRKTDPQAALALLDEHASLYPEGAFREEREALAIELTWAEGQQTAARDRLVRFLARYPASPYAQRFATWRQGHETDE
jgi:hypothetical protein